MSALLADVSGILKRGTQWWAGELASLVPAGLKRQPGNGQLDAIVAIGADGSGRLLHESSRQRPGKGQSTTITGQELWDYLSRLGRNRPNARVGLRLPFSACYIRRVEIPAAARRQAGSILALDLERATPFKAADVYFAHYIEPQASRKGWLNACQLVTKRAFADRWIADIEATGAKVARLDCFEANEKSPISIDFLSTSEPGTPDRAVWRRPGFLLTVLTAGLALSAASVAISRHEAALKTLEVQVASARAEASSARQKRNEIEATASQSSAMRNFKSGRPSTVEVLQELTRLLPDGVSIADLKIEGDFVDLSGFAKPAADVIPILERSEMFKDAALTSPVTFDSTEDKERFSLRVKFRKSPQAAAAAKPEEAAP